jgi:AraC-like DNA-binding protein
MNTDFYTSRSRQLFLSGYPMELITLSNDKSVTPTVSHHSHDEIELQFVSKGTIELVCNNEIIRATEGDIIFINKGIEHHAVFTNDNSELYSIIAHTNFILDFEQLELQNKYINPIICDNSFSYFLIKPVHPCYTLFLSPIQELIELNTQQEPGYELLSRAYLLQFWNVLYNVYNNTVAYSTKHLASNTSLRTEIQDEQRVRLACAYIYEHFSESITLEDISDSILVSKSECCRCFKRVCSLSPFEYLMKYRIVQATKHIQQNRTDSISDIAGAVGFNNISYFNKVFKKFMNCTPSQYKKSLYAS